jgi:hypothetical protein
MLGSDNGNRKAALNKQRRDQTMSEWKRQTLAAETKVMEQCPCVNLCQLNNDLLLHIGEALWGKDLCCIASTCSTMHDTYKERVRSCKKAEICVLKIRRHYSPLNRARMETNGLIIFTRNTWDIESAGEDVEAYRMMPPFFRNSLKNDFLTTYTTERYTQLQLTTHSVINRLLIPYVEGRDGFQTA